MTSRHRRRKTAVGVVVALALGMAVATIAAMAVELGPFDPMRPGRAHHGTMTVHDDCRLDFSSDDGVQIPSDATTTAALTLAPHWWSHDLGPPAWRGPDPTRVDGTLTVTSDRTATFTADSGGSIRIRRDFCGTAE